MSLHHSQGATDEEMRILEPKTLQCHHAHIYRLPPEVLLRIFELLRDPHFVKRWHRITHVCRHWRWIAVGAPMLWTFPPTHLEDYTLVMLKRSKMVPLAIALKQRTSELTTAAIFDNLQRICVLQIRQRDEKLIRTQNILRASTQVASDLVGLEVMNMGESHETFTLPSTPFRQSTSLCSLDLFHVSIDWNIFPLYNLTFLRLRMASSVTISLQQILRALTGTPSLEHLFLQLDLDVIEDTPTTPAIVRLHRLGTLGLPDFETSQLCRLMSSLHLPSLTNLGVDIDPEAANIDGYQGALSQISSTLGGGRFPTLDLAEFSAFSGEFTLSPRHARLSDLYRVTIQLPSASEEQINHYNIIRRLMSGMPSTARHNFEVLTHISIDADLGAKMLVRLFGSLPNLMALMIVPARTILALVRALKATTQNLGKIVMAFPRLISIGWCAFRWQRYGRNKLLDLCDTLTHRYNSGVGITQLYLSDCSKIPSDIVEALEEIGVHLRIDSDIYSIHDGWIVDDSIAGDIRRQP